MSAFHFLLVSPERTVFDGDAEAVSLRAEGGEIAFLAGHIPFVGEVEVSSCEIATAEGGTRTLAVHGGFVEVDPDGTVTLLADVVEAADEIDAERARRARDAASEAASRDEPGAEAALARAEVRLEVAGASTGSGTAPRRSGSAASGSAAAAAGSPDSA